MKKITAKLALRLSRETLMPLQNDSLETVAGGKAPTRSRSRDSSARRSRRP